MAAVADTAGPVPTRSGRIRLAGATALLAAGVMSMAAGVLGAEPPRAAGPGGADGPGGAVGSHGTARVDVTPAHALDGFGLDGWILASDSATDDARVARPTPDWGPPIDDGQVADPVGIRIPSIGVDAPVVPLGVDEAGALEVPVDFADTGWWQGGPEPGERGPAVVVGHVDSFEGPAVFFDLGQVQRGDRIIIDRADGTSAVFAVRSSMAPSKDRFPTTAVYGPTTRPELRLITCHGDLVDGSYDHNLIIFADFLA